MVCDLFDAVVDDFLRAGFHEVRRYGDRAVLGTPEIIRVRKIILTKNDYQFLYENFKYEMWTKSNDPYHRECYFYHDSLLTHFVS